MKRDYATQLLDKLMAEEPLTTTSDIVRNVSNKVKESISAATIIMEEETSDYDTICEIYGWYDQYKPTYDQFMNFVIATTIRVLSNEIRRRVTK